MSEHVSEYARGIGELVDLLEPRIYEELLQLLINFDELPMPGRDRAEMIGLLTHMLSQSTGSLVPRGEYEAEQARRALNGESWPTAAELVKSYWSWEDAHRIAQLVLRGERRGISSEHRSRKDFSVAYTASDITGCLREAKAFFGNWNFTAQQYVRWAKIKREAERTSGRLRRFHIPTLGTVLNHFGTWAHAIEVCMAEEKEEEAE